MSGLKSILHEHGLQLEFIIGRKKSYHDFPKTVPEVKSGFDTVHKFVGIKAVIKTLNIISKRFLFVNKKRLNRVYCVLIFHNSIETTKIDQTVTENLPVRI